MSLLRLKKLSRSINFGFLSSFERLLSLLRLILGNSELLLLCSLPFGRTIKTLLRRDSAVLCFLVGLLLCSNPGFVDLAATGPIIK